MDFIKEPNRIYAKGNDGTIVAEVTFPSADGKTYVINHTFVDDSLRGMGIAGKLVQMAVEQITSQGGLVQATCSYAGKWLEKNRK